MDSASCSPDNQAKAANMAIRGKRDVAGAFKKGMKKKQDGKGGAYSFGPQGIVPGKSRQVRSGEEMVQREKLRSSMSGKPSLENLPVGKPSAKKPLSAVDKKIRDVQMRMGVNKKK